MIAQEENRLSRTVAENSKRDSAAMKTIAILTMFFLPPTFVAVNYVFVYVVECRLHCRRHFLA